MKSLIRVNVTMVWFLGGTSMVLGLSPLLLLVGLVVETCKEGHSGFLCLWPQIPKPSVRYNLSNLVLGLHQGLHPVGPDTALLGTYQGQGWIIKQAYWAQAQGPAVSHTY